MRSTKVLSWAVLCSVFLAATAAHAFDFERSKAKLAAQIHALPPADAHILLLQTALKINQHDSTLLIDTAKNANYAFEVEGEELALLEELSRAAGWPQYADYLKEGVDLHVRVMRGKLSPQQFSTQEPAWRHHILDVVQGIPESAMTEPRGPAFVALRKRTFTWVASIARLGALAQRQEHH